MIGSVLNSHALISLPLCHPNQPVMEIEFVVDTGFIGFLALPPAAISALGLPYLQDIVATLADGSEIQVAVHLATIRWHGEEHDVQVLATSKRPLLGTALLGGSELVAQFVDGGLVSIDPL